MTQPNYPECEKLSIVAPKSQAIGEFLEWLMVEKEIYLCKRTEPCMNCRTCYDDKDGCENLQFDTIQENKEKLLAEFFDIDLSLVETERQALLEHIRENRPCV